MNKKISFSIIVFLIFAAVSTSHSTAFAGGDIGGGGVAKLLELSPQEIEVLKKEQDSKAAFNQWLKTIDESKEMRVLQKLYELHVVPQLK